MAKGEDALEVLRSIDVTLKALLVLAQRRSTGGGATAGAVASDRDLDSQYGDPELKFNPRDWTGASYKGRRFSECPPALLDQIAESNEYFATQADLKGETTTKGKPVSTYKRADAARARGWAKRIRDGKHVQAAESSDAGGSTWSDAEGATSADGWAEDGF